MCGDIWRTVSHSAQGATCQVYYTIEIPPIAQTRYSELISTHELGKLLDEEMTKEERLDLEDSEAVCRRFLTWDLDDKQGLGEGGVKTKLAEVLGKNFFDP